jgi:hypothetical protein
VTFRCHTPVRRLPAHPPSRPVNTVVKQAPPGEPVTGPRLAGFHFRERPPLAAADPARAATGDAWSLELTLHELRRRGATLLATDHGVRLVTPRRHPRALARAVDQHGPALLVGLKLGVLDNTTPAPWSAVEWDDTTRIHAAWFGLRFSPRVPFDIASGVRVTDHFALRRAVAADLAAGPAAPSAGPLRRTLAELYTRFGPARSRLRVIPPSRALAA